MILANQFLEVLELKDKELFWLTKFVLRSKDLDSRRFFCVFGAAIGAFEDPNTCTKG